MLLDVKLNDDNYFVGLLSIYTVRRFLYIDTPEQDNFTYFRRNENDGDQLLNWYVY